MEARGGCDRGRVGGKKGSEGVGDEVSARAAVEVAAGGMVRIQWLGMAEAHRRSRLDCGSWATLTECRSSRRRMMVARLERRLEMMAQRTGEVTAGCEQGCRCV